MKYFSPKTEVYGLNEAVTIIELILWAVFSLKD